MLRIARICLHATARPKYVILFLLMVSAALANPPTGIRDLVHQAPGPQEILNGAMQYLVRSLSGLQRRMSQSEPSVSRNLPAARTLMPVTAPAMEVIGTPVADARMNPRPQWDLALANPLDVPRQHSTLVAAATEFNDVLPPRPSSMASAPVTLTGASSAHADARAVDAGSFVWMPPSHADAARAAVASLASAAPSVSSPTAPLGDTGTLDFSPPRVLTAAPVSDIAPITGIPEPAGALLIAGAATLLLRRRRHRRPPQ